MYLKQRGLLALVIAVLVAIGVSAGYFGSLRLMGETFIGCGHGVRYSFGCYTALGLYLTFVLMALAVTIGLLLRRFSAY
jgi:hypothetical protein